MDLATRTLFGIAAKSRWEFRQISENVLISQLVGSPDFVTSSSPSLINPS
jgi:hypothetical protein